MARSGLAQRVVGSVPETKITDFEWAAQEPLEQLNQYGIYISDYPGDKITDRTLTVRQLQDPDGKVFWRIAIDTANNARIQHEAQYFIAQLFSFPNKLDLIPAEDDEVEISMLMRISHDSQEQGTGGFYLWNLDLNADRTIDINNWSSAGVHMQPSKGDIALSIIGKGLCFSKLNYLALPLPNAIRHKHISPNLIKPEDFIKYTYRVRRHSDFWIKDGLLIDMTVSQGNSSVRHSYLLPMILLGIEVWIDNQVITLPAALRGDFTEKLPIKADEQRYFDLAAVAVKRRKLRAGNSSS